MKFKGAWTALVTPFREDESVDWEGLEKNVEFQIKEGILGLLPMGTTGESPTVSHEEHGAINKKVFERAAGRCGILAGCGSNSTEESIKSVKFAAEAGIKAALIIDCYYNGPSSFELRTRHYGRLAEAFPDIELVPYIIPGRTGCELSAYDLALLAGKHANINAVKEATGDLERMAIERSILPEDFAILSGDDGITFEMMASPKIKAKGVISVLSNIVPAAISRMCEAALTGKYGEAGEINKKLKPLFDVITVKSTRVEEFKGIQCKVTDKFRNPVPVKTLMRALSMPAGKFRAPLGEMTPAGVLTLRSALKSVWLLSPEILKPVQEFYGADIAKVLSDDSLWASLCSVEA
ncbi:MAG: 4-hydroxy-tetrahydrodipicolinate synthase [Elusimicrobia bacterium CG_4_10_14_3_um_filter_49_12_50_7]|nr:MAG: 4-hydroxy-tetrahydrodipicolinate synthase [Elusimicrobia bacterium CG03_land_8_20_14_0_80_50_18]PIX14837.1 MAG: 4-hydroxy-tetrahydrodipicolinate synthase [Elusimicrobia bacterium CG_4_8_14_3_um_filter_50_9]PIY16430.1 MAG: 4-hydroxy-tetrahydrodipicolinate synthase [Elusimicrobia bacterium CG_4_10_14_3_um_filter_49_12_50_7]